MDDVKDILRLLAELLIAASAVIAAITSIRNGVKIHENTKITKEVPVKVVDELVKKNGSIIVNKNKMPGD